MPRPNPPRKRPRRRQSAARADAELTRQTAQSGKPRSQPSPKPAPSASGGGGAAAAAAPPDELWSRRSYAILIALIAATEVVIGLILYGLAPPPKDVYSLVAEMIGLQPFQPFPLLAACLLAAPVARRITREARPLRFVETLVVGVIIYFIFIVLVTAAGFLISPGGAGGSSNACATPHASPVSNTTPGSSPSASSSPSGTPCPSPSPSASGSGSSPSASPRAGASASPSPGATTVASGTNLSPSEVLAAAGGAWVASYVLAIYIYPPLYRRLRVRRPPPGSDTKGGSGSSRGGRGTSG